MRLQSRFAVLNVYVQRDVSLNVVSPEGLYFVEIVAPSNVVFHALRRSWYLRVTLRKRFCVHYRPNFWEQYHFLSTLYIYSVWTDK